MNRRLTKCKRCKQGYYPPEVVEDHKMCSRCERELCQQGTPPPWIIDYWEWPVFENEQRIYLRQVPPDVHQSSI